MAIYRSGMVSLITPYSQSDQRFSLRSFRYATGCCVSAAENTLQLVAGLATAQQYCQSLASPYRHFPDRYRVL